MQYGYWRVVPVSTGNKETVEVNMVKGVDSIELASVVMKHPLSHKTLQQKPYFQNHWTKTSTTKTQRTNRPPVTSWLFNKALFSINLF